MIYLPTLFILFITFHTLLLGLLEFISPHTGVKRHMSMVRVLLDV